MKTGWRFGVALGLALAAGGAAARAADVTLQFWTSEEPGSAEAKKNADEVARFETSHPGVHVAIQQITFAALHDKLITAAAAGDAPDVSWGLIEWLGELNRMGALLDLQPYAATWPDRTKIYPNVLAELTIDGHLKALPNYLGIRALLYHADLLQKAGLTTPPKTWADLVAMAQTIKSRAGVEAFGVSGTGVRTPQELLSWFAQNNVGIAEPTKDGKYRNEWDRDAGALARATAVFQLYRDMLDKNVIPAASTGWAWQQEDTNFALGHVATVMDGAWMTNYDTQYPDSMRDVKLADPPILAKQATFFEVNPIYVMAGSKHPKEAFELAAFIDSADYQGVLFKDRSPRTDVTSDDQWGRALVSLAPYGISFPPVALGAIAQSMQDSVGRVLLAHQSPETVARWLGRMVNKALRQSGELGTS